MNTHKLLEKYLQETEQFKIDISLENYKINGSSIKVMYYYFKKDDENKIDRTANEEIEILDFITWVYDKCKTIKENI